MPSTRRSICSIPVPTACGTQGNSVKQTTQSNASLLYHAALPTVSVMKLKLLTDSDADVPFHRILNSIPLLGYGKIDPEP